MLRYFISSSLWIILLISKVQSQVPCEYVPLQLGDLQPIWSHLVIDSTIIGYDDTSAVHWNFYVDGMNHLGREITTILNDNYLYSFTELLFDIDEAGYLIDKVDLENGDHIWQIVSDPRTVPLYGQKLLHAYIDSDKLIVQGVREQEKNDVIFGLDMGGFPTLYFTREYDLQTGELLYEYTPDTDDSNNYIFNSQHNKDFVFFNENTIDHFERTVKLEKGSFLIRNISDINGKTISTNDTVNVGVYNHLWAETYPVDSDVLPTKLAQTTEGNYLYIEHLIPNDTSSIETKIMITEYDKDFNPIKSRQISDNIIEDIDIVYINRVEEDRIILNCLDRKTPFFAFLFYYILDRDFNIIRKIDCRDEDGIPIATEGTRSEYFNENNDVFFSKRTLNNTGHSDISFHRSTENGLAENLKSFTIAEEKWVGFIEQHFVLDNGDHLVRINHSCYNDGHKESWHPVWWRIAAEDIGILSSVILPSEIVEIAVSPNPATESISIYDLPLGNYTYNISDMSGRTIIFDKVELSENIVVNISSLQSGIYIMNLTNENGQKFQSKFAVN